MLHESAEQFIEVLIDTATLDVDPGTTMFPADLLSRGSLQAKGTKTATFCPAYDDAVALLPPYCERAGRPLESKLQPNDLSAPRRVLIKRSENLLGHVMTH